LIDLREAGAVFGPAARTGEDTADAAITRLRQSARLDETP
jgi:hypothetical protein